MFSQQLILKVSYAIQYFPILRVTILGFKRHKSWSSIIPHVGEESIGFADQGEGS